MSGASEDGQFTYLLLRYPYCSTLTFGDCSGINVATPQLVYEFMFVTLKTISL